MWQMIDDALIAEWPEARRTALAAWCAKSLRPGVEVTAQRTWKRRWPWRWFARAWQPLILARTASKLGGVPYLTDAAQWPRIGDRPLQWLGQINFAEVRPHQASLPERGILAMWFDRSFWRGRPPLVCRWFPEPDAARAADLPGDAPQVTWLYETALHFRPTRWYGDVDDDALAAILTDCELDERDRVYDRLDSEGREHHATQELLASTWRDLARDLGESRRGRTVLYRISFENEAGFAWGTNTFYLHIADQDLANGALDRVTAAVANF